MKWPTATLDELCEIQIGRTPARANPEFWGAGAPWLSIADMNQGRSITQTREQITAAGAAGGREVQPGTVLLSFKLSIGKVSRAAIPLFTNEAIAALPVKRSEVITEDFLMRALEHADLTGSSNRAAMGATLNKATLRGLAIPLPPLPEQRRVAAILDSADALRAKRRQVLAYLDALTQSIFHDMFGDPTDNRRHDEVKELHELITPGRPITYGILKPGPDLPNGIPYVRVADIQNGAINLNTVRRTSAEIASSYRRSVLREGDLLISIRGHVGRFAHVPAELAGANITQDSARLSIDDVATSQYVRGAMTSVGLQRWMARHTKGVAVRGLNIGDLRQLPIPVPPLLLRQRFAERVERVDAQRAAVQHAVNADDELFASLQARAFDGRL